MPNPNPTIANLTNAGKGRPKLNRVKVSITMSEHNKLLLAKYVSNNQISLSAAIERAIAMLLAEG